MEIYMVTASWITFLLTLICSTVSALIAWIYTKKQATQNMIKLEGSYDKQLQSAKYDLTELQSEFNEINKLYQQLQLQHTKTSETLKYSQIQLQEKIAQLHKLQDNLNETIAETKHESIEYNKISTKLDLIQQDINQKTVEISSLKTELEDAKQSYNQEKIKTAELEEKLKSMNFIEKSKDLLSEHFTNIANAVIDSKSKSLNERHEDNLTKVLEPVKQQITQFNAEIKNVYKESISERSALSSQLESSLKLHNQMSQDAQQLTQALKGDKKLQGCWGEVQLERLLEVSGLIKDIEFQREPEIKDENNNKLRPDFIINLPDGKHLIIDSKVSLVDYIECVATEDNAIYDSHAKKHCNNIRNHIKSLAEKNYAATTDINSPQFVFMFVPIESALLLAIKQNQDLIYDAFQKNIIIASPTTLLASLKTVANLWSIERQNANTRKLAEKAASVYNKLTSVADNLVKLKNSIVKVSENYNETIKVFSEGKGNLVATCSAFKQLGVNVKKEIPATLPLINDITEASADTTKTTYHIETDSGAIEKETTKTQIVDETS
jgi:DNA recombination protein RmuC